MTVLSQLTLGCDIPKRKDTESENKVWVKSLFTDGRNSGQFHEQSKADSPGDLPFGMYPLGPLGWDS